MNQQNITIRADEMTCDFSTGQGMALGNVHFDLPQGLILDTPMAEFNINTGWWKIYSADMWLEPSGYIGCEEAVKTDPNTINLKNLRFTACPSKYPDWEIRARKGILKTGRYIKISHLSLRIKGVPVFYFPIASYLPLNGANIKGLQPPEAGHSSRHGYFIKNLFTWPINPRTEGLLFIDFFTHTGIGLGTGWKYLKDEDEQGSEGKIYLLGEKKTEKIYGKIDLSLDIGRSDAKRSVIELHTVTDRGFDQRFSSESIKRDARIEESRAFLSRYRSGLGIIAGLEHIRSLPSSAKDEIYILPDLLFHLQPKSINIGGKGISSFIGLDLSAGYMDWDSKTNNGESAGYTLQPQIFMPLSITPWTKANSVFLTKQSYFNSPNVEKRGWSKTYIFDFTLTGPRFIREYKKGSSRRKQKHNQISHMIYPQINYNHKTHDGIQPEYFIDPEEYKGELESISFSLINRLFYKNKNHILSNLDLVISQKLNLREKSDVLEIHATAKPHPVLGLNGRANLETKGGHRKDIDSYLSFGSNEKGEIDIGWRYLLDNTDIGNLNTTYLVVSSKPIFKGYRFKTSFIYDWESKSRIEEEYTLLYQGMCLKARVALVRRFDEDLVRISLNLIF